MDSRTEADIDAIKQVMKGEAALEYGCWELQRPECRPQEESFFAIYSPRPDRPFDHYAVFQVGDIPPIRVFSELVQSEIEEVVPADELWQVVDSMPADEAESLIRRHEQATAELSLPLGLMTFGLDLGMGNGTHIYYPQLLSVSMCFDWFKDAARRYIASRN